MNDSQEVIYFDVKKSSQRVVPARLSLNKEKRRRERFFLAQDLLQFTTRIRDLLNTRPVSSDRKMRTL
jgi:hypothetical protein